MPRTFNPGHRPDSPLFPNSVVYCTAADVADFLQIPLPDPISLAADSSITTGTISFPITGAEYRRWKLDTGSSITVYDDANAKGITYTVTGTASAGSGNVAIQASTSGSESFTTAQNAKLQIEDAFTNSKERGITKSHVEDLIKIKQDYIDTVTRMAWRPRIVVDEYQNFTTFKPYRRRYYTDYVGAVYLKNRAVQRVLRLSVWQGDEYKELGASRIKMEVLTPTNLNATEKIFLCPGIDHSATLERGKSTSQWDGDFGAKSIAQQISDLINEDTATSKAAIQIGTIQENGSTLNVSHEFLATANSDEGDGKVVLSSMRSTEEGANSTIATTNPDGFIFSLGSTLNSAVTSVTDAGATFVLSDGSGFTLTHGLVYYTKAGITYVARCSRSGNTFTVTEELVAGFKSQLNTDQTMYQSRLKTDVTDEERQRDWWSMEDNGAIMFNNQYPFFENHSLKICYVYGERYLDKTIKDACVKMVSIDILLTDDYTVLFPEGTNNVDLNAKIQKLEEEVKRMLIPYQESIIVAGMGG